MSINRVRIYQHIKSGGLYDYITEGLCEETGKSYTVYKCRASGITWIRPTWKFKQKFRIFRINENLDDNVGKLAAIETK